MRMPALEIFRINGNNLFSVAGIIENVRPTSLIRSMHIDKNKFICSCDIPKFQNWKSKVKSALSNKAVNSGLQDFYNSSIFDQNPIAINISIFKVKLNLFKM